MLVASAAARRGNTELAAACVAAFADARNTSAYCSPYALAAALVCAAVWTPDAPTYAVQSPAPGAPIQRPDPEDGALAHLAQHGNEPLSDALARISAQYAPTCHAPCAFERRVRTVMVPAWQAAFPAMQNI
jgi:hypothetical protein